MRGIQAHSAEPPTASSKLAGYDARPRTNSPLVALCPGRFVRLIWWTWSGSNRRPLPCHGSALPTAPQAHVRRECNFIIVSGREQFVNPRPPARTTPLTVPSVVIQLCLQAPPQPSFRLSSGLISAICLPEGIYPCIMVLGCNFPNPRRFK